MSREEKRNQLIELSNKAKLIIELNGLDFPTLNEAIITLFYKKDNPDITELKTFNQWKEDGKKILKGSKAFTVWAKPIKAKNKAEETKEEKNEYQFFPIANVFSNLQVQ